MRTFNELNLQGYVGKVVAFEKATKVSIATERSWKDGDEWQRETDWVDVTILNPKRARWVAENIGKGDLVFAKARVANSSFEKDGQTHYTVDIIAERFSLIAAKADQTEDQGDE
jgi:single-strand DNA-binding protein